MQVLDVIAFMPW